MAWICRLSFFRDIIKLEDNEKDGLVFIYIVVPRSSSAAGTMV